MSRSTPELWYSLIVVVVTTVLYIFVVAYTGSIPAAREFFGHSLGILGFVLMVLTETLYSMRKRSRRATLGKMSSWLQFHIFTGLVGPYLVLLHTSWKFHGLAGVVFLLTVIIVASGFVGRYIYTAVPRTVDGVVLEAAQIRAQVAAIETRLHSQGHTWLSEALLDSPSAGQSQFIWARPWILLRHRIRWFVRRMQLSPKQRRQAVHMEMLDRRRLLLLGQLEALAMARRALSVWHAVHIPIGVALFASATVHILAAVYYASLLR